jgi:hypothetical protein
MLTSLLSLNKNKAVSHLSVERRTLGRGFRNQLTEIVSRYESLMARYSPRDRFTDSKWSTLLAILHERWPQADRAATSPKHISEVLRQAGEAESVELVESMKLAETTPLIERGYADLTRG